MVQISKDSMDFLYAYAVLTKMFTGGVISTGVYETAVKKARERFNKNTSAA
jgi:hypothetical protein